MKSLSAQTILVSQKESFVCAAAVSADEAERLAALSSFDVMDTSPEKSFDGLTRTASKVFGVPICLVSLVDDKRQFFKSHLGVSFTETPREQAFCAHTIERDEVLVVCDAMADERFARNPLVTGDPNIRFYAGAPLITREGLRLGSLCVMDTVARSAPTLQQIEILEDLSAQAMELLEAGKARKVTRGLRTDLDEMIRAQFADRERWQRAQEAAALALHAGKMGFWEWDARTGEGRWSDRLFEIMRFPIESVPPRASCWLKRVHPNDRGALLEKVKSTQRVNQSFTAKFRLFDETGAEHSVTTIGNYYFRDTGSLLGALGVAWDSTESDRKDRALADSEELFRGLSESSPVGIFSANVQGVTTYVNQRLAEIWDITTEHVFGWEWLKRIHPEDADEITECWRMAVEHGLAFRREYRLLMADGSIRWVEGRCAILRLKSGKLNGLVGTIDDITDRRGMLQELKEAKELAEAASRSKDLFLANTSHELRTPLNGVLGMTTLLLDTTLSAEQRELAETVRESGRSLLMVVNDILDLSRIEAGKLGIETAPFDGNGVLSKAVKLVSPEARKKGLILELKPFPRSVPRLWGDSGRIKQILLVYLTNALKFTTTGSVSVKATATRLAGERWDVQLTVRDTGPGVGEKDQAKLFQPFSQVDASSTRRHGGVGLGLAIAGRLAELMGGSVGVTSSLGEGATFWLRLILRTATEVTTEESGTHRPRISLGGRVLVVEDNLVNQTVAVSALRRLGWKTDVAANGVAALDLVRANEYALVLMDCQMPILDGYSATQQIRTWEKSHNRTQVPIIALTAHAMTGDRERCLDAGMNDYLSKPFGLDELRIALERWGKVAVTAPEMGS